ncbi:MAG: hypothetical protein J7J42_01375 [Thermoplasmata archaeon]|nr:hypothetical protein [Thermoplasmata archaeon]
MDFSGLVFIILLPLLSLFIGLIILGAFAFKLSPAENLRPTRDIYSSPYARLILQELAAKEYEKIDKIKNLNKLSNRRNRMKKIVPAIIGFGIFIISLVVLVTGFDGILLR